MSPRAPACLVVAVLAAAVAAPLTPARADEPKPADQKAIVVAHLPPHPARALQWR